MTENYVTVTWADIRPGDVATIVRTGGKYRVAERDERHGWWCHSYGGGRRYRLNQIKVIRGNVKVMRRVAN